VDFKKYLGIVGKLLKSENSDAMSKKFEHHGGVLDI
jgi:hypothetical protein